MNKKLIARQGDVLFFEVDELPKPADATPIDTGEEKRYVLALGETTGHSHQMPTDAKDAAVKYGTNFAINLASPRTCTHEEHAPVSLPPGNYLVEIQRNYIGDEIRAVAD